MKTYALIYNESVIALYTPPDIFAEIPITDLICPLFDPVDLTGVTPEPQLGWHYVDGTFAAPSN